MSWDIFRSEYKNGRNIWRVVIKQRCANVIGSSYDKCIKTGFKCFHPLLDLGQEM